MLIPKAAPSADTITSIKGSPQCVYVWGCVLMRIAIRKASWLMLSCLSCSLMLLLFSFRKAMWMLIVRTSMEDPLGRKTASYMSITFNLQPEICSAIALNATSLEEWHSFWYLQSPGHHKLR